MRTDSSASTATALTSEIQNAISTTVEQAVSAAVRPLLDQIKSNQLKAARNRPVQLPSELVDFKAVADMIDLSTATLDRMIRKGKFPPPLPGTKSGGKRLFKRADILGWIECRAAGRDYQTTA